ncbi:MAG: hypothetical protein HLX50_24200 [Alteromonadaceae bacterium]|nr:hypothetical protein [Alteromonadaceae bacterium]
MGYKVLGWVGITLTLLLGVSIIICVWVAPDIVSTLSPFLAATVVAAVIGVFGYRKGK